MPRLFRRSYSLQVDTLAIRELNIAFAIERSLHRHPGRCEIKVWNLGETHRRQLEGLRAGHVFVELNAGYEGDESLIFRGELHRARSERSGPDIVTTIRSRDGHAAHSARASVSHAAGVSFGSVVRSVVGAMGIGEGNLGDFLSTASMGGVATFAAGATVSGSASDHLDRMMTSAGLEWSIQDGALQVLRRGEGLTRPAIRLSPETGLLGSPVIDEHGKIKAQALLISGMAPGGLVALESADHNGTYRIERVHFKAEFGASDWGAELTLASPTSRARAAA